MVCMNVYDIRMKDEPYPECGLSWPYELSDVTNYLRVSNNNLFQKTTNNLNLA